MKCRACKNTIDQFLSLGKMPSVNAFLKREEMTNETKTVLAVGFCRNCYLVQLMKTISPKKLFSHYIYFSSNSLSFLKHCAQTVDHLVSKLKLNKKSFVIEIASNDGAFLQYFKKYKIAVLGIDPAENIARLANQKGINTLSEFFNYSFANQLLKKGVSADLVYGANVLAHVPKIVDFLRGIKIILKPKATAVFEFPYVRGLLENKFDIIYHEHVFYFGILALINLFRKANLEIYDVEETAMQGGSLRIYASHPNNFLISKSLKTLISQEKNQKFNKLSTYKEMNLSIIKLKKNIINTLKKLKKSGKTIAAYGAPAKGVILSNYLGIDKKYIDFIVDKAPEKQGLYVPGIHLLVESPDKIMTAKPDYLIILCWNIADEIIAQLKDYRLGGGKFIIPVPKLQMK